MNKINNWVIEYQLDFVNPNFVNSWCLYSLLLPCTQLSLLTFIFGIFFICDWSRSIHFWIHCYYRYQLFLHYHLGFAQLKNYFFPLGTYHFNLKLLILLDWMCHRRLVCYLSFHSCCLICWWILLSDSLHLHESLKAQLAIHRELSIPHLQKLLHMNN